MYSKMHYWQITSSDVFVIGKFIWRASMALPNIDRLNLDQLLELEQRVDALLAERRADALKELRQKFQEMAAESGFDLSEIIGVRRGRPAKKISKIAPKYRHPKDPSLAWTGRGRQPKWLVAELEEGRELESFLIH
jgi:DNA-binding protein H-NS